MAIEGNQLASFGDVRRFILDTVRDVRSGNLESGKGAVIFQGIKELNANIQVEINAAKLALATKDEAHSFGRVVGMGQRLIANDESQVA